jgi:DNA uptake protein ComE-like DNA-binding protein
MKSLNQKFKEYFSFTKGELIGITVLLFIITSILMVPLIIKSFNSAQKTNITNFDSKLIEFQNKINNSPPTNYRQNIKSQTKGQNSGTIFTKQKEEEFIIELNASDSLELMRLRGIGPAFAKKIMSYRKLLGGYYNKEQLLEVWGMDITRYNTIKDHIRVERDSIHKININTEAFKLLMKHPYIKYEIARSIIIYRKEHGNFKNIDELKSMENINDSIFNKLNPYIKVR